MSNSKLLTGYIDVTKITREKLTEGKDGRKYLNIAVWLNEAPDQFGNIASIQESQSKEEREAGKSKNYLGNLKEFVKQQASAPSAPASAPAQENDLPF